MVSTLALLLFIIEWPKRVDDSGCIECAVGLYTLGHITDSEFRLEA
jgi:hypothetical protein